MATYKANAYFEDGGQAVLAAFAAHFPDKRLLALHLDGFSHEVVYDDGPGSAGKPLFADVSFCMGAEEELSYRHGRAEKQLQRGMRAFMEDAGFTGHSQFQGRAVEITFVEPKDR